MIPFISSNFSALRSLGKKMAVIANNIAKIESEGFKENRAVLKEGPARGVSAEISQIDTPGCLVSLKEDDRMVEREVSNVELTQEITKPR